ncbi:protein phosphatase 1 regulatory subunit hypothetical protein [Limosa lapponica baueri]|uniref:Uncharacterized protein n=1 Tax=Limosa lapponica baueri TaxID=1758121 RepID=A0A2I0T8F6_LIMLA|nr:protein phosphatase 1 regulatory subunit hypothetical protein [Limosa lapponica baueri]
MQNLLSPLAFPWKWSVVGNREKSPRTKSYLTPVRDEEAESLRKARSRQARQTRRSTQAVYRRLRCPVQPDKPTTPVSPSTSAPLLYTSSYLSRTNKYLGLDSVNPADFRGAATEMEKNECEDQDLDDRSLNKQSIRERRRPKERRRGTGIIFSTKDDDDEVDGNEDVKETRCSLCNVKSRIFLPEKHHLLRAAQLIPQQLLFIAVHGFLKSST